MADESVFWNVSGKRVAIGLTRAGTGPRALLLPALSSIATRFEMRPLQERLAGRYATVSIDWPGFGDRPRPFVDWTPVMFDGYLDFVLREICPQPDLIVAAGHGAGYVMRAFQRDPALARRVVFAAPTWRGPLPTMMKGTRPWFAKARRIVDRPALGPLLYRLNVNPFMVRKMAAEHVYSDPSMLAGARLIEKRAVAEAEGARHASVRFVTGGLDPFSCREDALAALAACKAGVDIVYGLETPRGSKAEIEAMGSVRGVTLHALRRGKLLVHEEFPDEVAEITLAQSPAGAVR
ncbi:alpha/beta hydrolase [Acuticoccus kandeliae]|uniref:alpha/beta hydrolase n=1 Tax=Acuticoccus kandeliae TaxID=2073160 RepID=UPI00130090CC|nr:alpha/beta hydrolase [Acuticoccus kandeliae]